jgi:hypothetical protein
MAGKKVLKFAEYPNASVLAFDADRLVVFAGPASGYSGPRKVIAYSVTQQ